MTHQRRLAGATLHVFDCAERCGDEVPLHRVETTLRLSLITTVSVEDPCPNLGEHRYHRVTQLRHDPIVSSV
jgi:hypothetical protein